MLGGDAKTERCLGLKSGHWTNRDTEVQSQAGVPVGATTAPAAPAMSRPLTTPPRRRAQSQTSAPTRIGICHRCASSKPSGIADPAIAPITAGPAPVRNASTARFARIR
jgi:hypothetical protein